jgi:hypothetical protein
MKLLEDFVGMCVGIVVLIGIGVVVSIALPLVFVLGIR